MNARDDEFMRELMTAFTAEAADHLQALSAGLLELEKHPPADRAGAIVECIYREAHSLKGAARAVSLPSVEAVCQALENVLSAWKRGMPAVSGEQFDLLHRSIDVARGLVAGSKPEAASVEGLVRQLGGLVAGSAPQGPAPSPAPAGAAAAGAPAAGTPPEPPGVRLRPAESGETVRITTAKLDALLFQVEELLAVKQAASQRVSDLREILDRFGPWQRRWDKLRAEMHSAGVRATGSDAAGPQPAGALAGGAVELVDWGLGQARDIQERLGLLTARLSEDERAGGRMVDGLLENARRVLMLPASTILSGFPRMVRDLCRSQGKEAELVIRGDDVEIDKRILEEMKDPLTHLLRNSVDHGIEPPAGRSRAGKPTCGRVEVTFSQPDSRSVQICVHDDGAGIDVERVKEAAVREGILAAEDAGRLSRQDALMLIYRSAVSTSAAVSSVSGRGLGLAIVREKADRVGGRVAVESTPGEGTLFTIEIPLTLATFRGILLETSGRLFVIPTMGVERIVRIRTSDVRSLEGRAAVDVGGHPVALARLSEVLGLPAAADAADASFLAFVAAAGERRMAFRIDRVLGEQEVLVKPLGSHLPRVRNVSGATVLGTGELVVVLNLSDLIRSAAAEPAAAGSAGTPSAEPRPARSILVVEDSFTSRMLLKNILESAGYVVKTGVDGLAAWALLKTEPFDAVVSDVEMPVMDGFELTARIRADRALAELPVILVTARERREDRERGVDAGANAYLTKSSFDQSQLLSVLERLV